MKYYAVGLVVGAVLLYLLGATIGEALRAFIFTTIILLAFRWYARHLQRAQEIDEE